MNLEGMEWAAATLELTIGDCVSLARACGLAAGEYESGDENAHRLYQTLTAFFESLAVGLTAQARLTMDNAERVTLTNVRSGTVEADLPAERAGAIPTPVGPPPVGQAGRPNDVGRTAGPHTNDLTQPPDLVSLLTRMALQTAHLPHEVSQQVVNSVQWQTELSRRYPALLSALTDALEGLDDATASRVIFGITERMQAEA